MNDIIIKKNEKYTLDITGLTHEGQGVGKIEGFVVFVDGALPGETIEVLIIKVTKSYAVGKLLHIIKKAETRTEPFCPVYSRCGGCAAQHMTYEAQLDFKTDIVRQSLRRIGGLEKVTVHKTIGMDEPYNYRNKVQYPVCMEQDAVKIGFYSNRSHNIIDSSECRIQPQESNDIKGFIKDFIVQKAISAYDESTGKGLFRHLMVRKGFKTNEIMVVLVLNGRKLPHQQELITGLTTRFSNIKSIFINVNTQKTNIILGQENICIFGQKYISDFIGRYKFNISPLSFFQVNPIQTEVLYGKALEYAGLSGNETVFDLYCGIGTISLFLSEKAKRVIGVEVVPEAINDARENARLNKVNNVEFFVGEAEKVIPELYKKGASADVVVVDPPRKGCDETLLNTLLDMQPERIVYVSCNPATLARDLGHLCKGGYQVQEVQPVDMFPWASHVEATILMTRCGSDDEK